MSRLVYLHGFCSSPNSSKARYFREQFPGILVPQLDSGDFEHLTVSGQLAVVEGERPDVLVGSSLGGYLAALYAARHAEVERVVLMAPAFGFARRWAETLGAQRIEEWRRNGTIDVFHYGERRQCSLGYQLLEDARRYEDDPDFRQPALIFHGRQDDVVPVEYSERFAASHPNVQLEVLESGHELLNVLPYMAERVAGFLR